MQRTKIEAGLLSLFQLVATIRLVITVTLSLAWLLIARGRLSLFNWAELGIAVLLLAFLCWPGLPARLGSAFLPIAIILSIITTFVVPYSMLYNWTADLPANRDGFISVIQPIPTLLVLTVIIVWQYDMRRLWIFCLAVVSINLLSYHYWSPSARPSLPLFGSVLVLQAIVLPLIGYVVAHLITAQRAQRRALATANAQLKHYAATLEQLTISRERNRLARELHDTLAHTLSSLAVQLEATRSLWEHDPVGARTLLDAALVNTRGGLNEARRALQALRAAPLEDLGLLLAIQKLAETSAERAGFELCLQLPKHTPNLPPDVQQVMYRVAQEALENIVRHAAAQHVQVELAQQIDTIWLHIRDDGQGFDTNTIEAGPRLGLRGMRERARLADGQLEVNSQRGQGTSIRFTIGIAYDSRADL